MSPSSSICQFLAIDRPRSHLRRECPCRSGRWDSIPGALVYVNKSGHVIPSVVASGHWSRCNLDGRKCGLELCRLKLGPVYMTIRDEMDV